MELTPAIYWASLLLLIIATLAVITYVYKIHSQFFRLSIKAKRG